ncbi:MAG: heme utilization cystosolic carrier protein HutX [Hyphomicrobium sp.]|uniref:heme utilization cystosolic carrier protein HutX n=1 Tax=Hyphomicrobium sp. TaxID=82 RepID=UPI00132A8642|nr:heme utilization cystosolic carrier protein HutX [Hyphomicrobium sp.]KAB2943911.1 MAG: heme utilization cystosolic carrier protein HutX [Hyphomicrobium sp.]MBZ0208816.1 heme utilization cystosolic carrier protein HutX [Hyphomicrobium sp.]
MSSTVEDRPSLAARVAASPGELLEQIAREYGVSTFEVVRSLPSEQGTIAPGEAFADIMQDITTWGEILFLIHNADIVLECTGRLPPGSFAHGYFNIHGESPIGGHLKADNCKSIAFVARGAKRISMSVQFFNAAGDAMFKIFVGRDEARELLPDQVARFEALRSRYA